MRRARVRWDAVRRAHMIWDEMKCGMWSASVKSAVRQCEVWRKCLFGIAPGSRAGHVLGQQHGNRFAQSTHAPAWLAHGACKFYRWERSYSITLRQLPPRLVRVLLVNHPFWGTPIYWTPQVSETWWSSSILAWNEQATWLWPRSWIESTNHNQVVFLSREFISISVFVF